MATRSVATGSGSLNKLLYNTIQNVIRSQLEATVRRIYLDLHAIAYRSGVIYAKMNDAVKVNGIGRRNNLISVFEDCSLMADQLRKF